MRRSCSRQMLREFGYTVDISSVNELLAMLRVFACQQVASQEAPLVIVENAHRLNPSALRAICELAEIEVGEQRAVKIVLASNRPVCGPIVDSPAMEMPEGNGHWSDFHLRADERSRDSQLSAQQAAGSRW